MCIENVIGPVKMFIELFGFHCLACFTYQNEMLTDSTAG